MNLQLFLKKNSNNPLAYLVLLSTIAGFITSVLINKNVYEYDENNNLRIKCNNYILYTYYYVFLAIFLVPILTYINSFIKVEKYLNVKDYGIIILLIYGAILYGFGYLLRITNPKKLLIVHTLWFICLFLFTFLISSFLLYFALFDKIGLIIGFAVTVAICVTSYLFASSENNAVKNLYESRNKIRIAFFVFSILVLGIVFFIKRIPKEYIIPLFISISVISLIFVTILFIINNYELILDAEKCDEVNNVAHYPAESLRLFYKIINILIDVLNLLFFRRRRR